MTMIAKRAPATALACLIAAGALLIAQGVIRPAAADEENFPPVTDPLVAKECRACHMLYQPGLMPAASWQRLMMGLKDHFGENAELDAQSTESVLAYLTANAAKPLVDPKKPMPIAAVTPIRIIEMPWFVRKHNRKDRISPAALARNNAKSPSDCVACHKQAEAGQYGD